ncbi:hypothetical protein Acr_01g0006590 [Actinidia rufa]|uniref:Uncharacterized protein n=1 Tax=Actinidia rufa TaxID=165716 RepID=A0A7J0DC06_9ERIC|nr:hypothetical protein Acr_00g0020360 [Actinidia rufa]GFY80850.1 hypothetical protein Acr_01g0006590 [Actinidia rufa]
MSGSPKKGSHRGKYTWAALATRTPSLDSTERRHLILMPETPANGFDAREATLGLDARDPNFVDPAQGIVDA